MLQKRLDEGRKSGGRGKKKLGAKLAQSKARDKIAEAVSIRGRKVGRTTLEKFQRSTIYVKNTLKFGII